MVVILLILVHGQIIYLWKNNSNIRVLFIKYEDFETNKEDVFKK